jgi:hypothetical protein
MVTSDLYGLQNIEDLAGMHRAQHGILLAQSRISLATQAYAVGSFPRGMQNKAILRMQSANERVLYMFVTRAPRHQGATGLEAFG